jgi:hypothetical protein
MSLIPWLASTAAGAGIVLASDSGGVGRHVGNSASRFNWWGECGGECEVMLRAQG